MFDSGTFQSNKETAGIGQTEMQEHKQLRESKKEHIDELQKKLTKQWSLKLWPVSEGSRRLIDSLTKRGNGKESHHEETEVLRLKGDYIKLVEWNQKQQCERQRRKVCWDMLKQAVKMTKFQEVQELINYVEILQRMKEQYHQRLFEADGKTDQLRKELQSGGAASLQNSCKSLMSCLCLKKRNLVSALKNANWKHGVIKFCKQHPSNTSSWHRMRWRPLTSMLRTS